MEAYTPLEPSTSAEFYLAQIEAAHAGKTMEIKLWDPGDTNSLSANLEDPHPDHDRLHERDAELHRREGHDQLERQQLQLERRHGRLQHHDEHAAAAARSSTAAG